jgi:hypothetical protein
VRFVFNHFDEAVPILPTMDFEFCNLIRQLVPLLEPVFLAVRTLECDDGSVATVVPEINKLVRRLKLEAGVIDEPIKIMYIHAAAVIKRRAFEKSNFLFQLACVLTHLGREETRIMTHASQQYHSDDLLEDEDDEDHGPRCHFGFAMPTDSLDSEDEDDLRKVMEDAGDENEEKETDEIESDNVESDDDNHDDEKESDLYFEAEQGLKEIPFQYQIRDDRRVKEIIGIFQYCMTASPCDLRLKPIPDRNRYQSAVMATEPGPMGIRGDIGLRLKALACNEAVSERTNGIMRRLLAPLRLKMGRDIPLSRLIIAKHGDSGSRSG